MFYYIFSQLLVDVIIYVLMLLFTCCPCKAVAARADGESLNVISVDASVTLNHTRGRTKAEHGKEKRERSGIRKEQSTT